MLELTKSETSEKIVVTLTELVTIGNPFFLFVFTNVVTKDQVKFIRSSADDESEFKERYNRFEVNSNILFGSKGYGLWDYVVYEQESADNLDYEGLNAIEYGKLRLLDAELEFDKYDEPVTFKTYNG